MSSRRLDVKSPHRYELRQDLSRHGISIMCQREEQVLDPDLGVAHSAHDLGGGAEDRRAPRCHRQRLCHAALPPAER